MFCWQLQSRKHLGTMDCVKPSVTGLAKTVWRELDCRLSKKLKSYQQQLSESYPQQDQEMEQTEKGLKTDNTREAAQRQEGEGLANFVVVGEEEIGRDSFSYVFSFPWTTSVEGRKVFVLPGSRDSFLSSVREVRPSRELQTSPSLKDHPQLSNKMFLSLQSHPAMPPFLAFTLRRQTNTHTPFQISKPGF